MRKLCLSLHQQLRQLQREQDRIAEAITEMGRRIRLLDEVMSCSLPVKEAGHELPQEDEPQDSDAVVTARGLVGAVNSRVAEEEVHTLYSSNYEQS